MADERAARRRGNPTLSAPVVPPDPSPDPGAVVAAARQALARTGHRWLERVEVVAEAGWLVLRGDVPSFYLKQLAQVTVLALPDVPGLRNELRVAHPG